MYLDTRCIYLYIYVEFAANQMNEKIEWLSTLIIIYIDIKLHVYIYIAIYTYLYKMKLDSLSSGYSPNLRFSVARALSGGQQYTNG